MDGPSRKIPWVDGALFNENRNKFPEEQLEPYAGQWVAFNHDATRILTAGKDLEEAMERLKASGYHLPDAVWEHLDPPDVDTWL
jgi:predicted RNase H-like HicB family nuclease